MGLGRRKVAPQLPPTSREVLPVRPLRGPWSYWGTGVAWGSQTALQMSGVRWGNAPSLLAPLPLLYTLCPRNWVLCVLGTSPPSALNRRQHLGKQTRLRGRHRVLT